MANIAIGIGVYTEAGELIGYKADSFWTLSKEYAKPDRLEAGGIRQSLIDNLNFILSGERDSVPVIGPIGKANRTQYYSEFETRLLGYFVLPDGPPVFTHRIFEREVQPLDDEDRKKLAQQQLAEATQGE